MKSISFNIHISGINAKYFTDNIMIYKPNISICINMSEEDLHYNKITDVTPSSLPHFQRKRLYQARKLSQGFLFHYRECVSFPMP